MAILNSLCHREFTQRRLVLPHPRLPQRLGPEPQEVEHYRRAPVGNDPAIELRESRGQRLAEDCVRGGAVARLVVGQRHVEPIEHGEHVAEVGDRQHVGIEMQRALETRRGHRVDTRAEPRILDDAHLREDARVDRLVGMEVDRQAGADPGDQLGGAARERPVSRAGRDEEDAVAHTLSTSTALGRD